MGKSKLIDIPSAAGDTIFKNISLKFQHIWDQFHNTDNVFTFSPLVEYVVYVVLMI